MKTHIRAAVLLAPLFTGCAARASASLETAKACRPVRELLDNGGFEAGHPGGFQAVSGQGRVIGNAIDAAGCEPGKRGVSAKDGRYLFSTAARDGGRKEARGNEVVLKKTIELDAFRLAPGARLAASAFVTNACASSVDNFALLLVTFLRGGQTIEQSDAQLSDVGAGWHQLVTPAVAIPAEADAVEIAYRAASSRTNPTIELWVDDLSLAVCGDGGTPLAAWTAPMEQVSSGAEHVVEPPKAEAPPAIATQACKVEAIDWKNRSYDGTAYAAGVSTKPGANDDGNQDTVDSVAFGDLDGDGAREALVTLMRGYDGGHGLPAIEMIYHVYTLRGCEAVELSAVQSPATRTSEGVEFSGGFGSAAKFERDALVLTRSVWADSDPECCPSFDQSETWKLVNGKITRVDVKRTRAKH